MVICWNECGLTIMVIDISFSITALGYDRKVSSRSAPQARRNSNGLFGYNIAFHKLSEAVHIS